ncbi:MAG: IclR family transcriptional regulator [Burkholderiales bacterium]|nr:IclR family transcriptional regulator [Burkholderiales bacterium]
MALLRELVAHQRHGSSTAQLAAGTGIDRATAHRMLQCLAAEELLTYDPATRKYHFGRLAFEIGFAASDRIDIPQLAKPTMTRLAERTGDTVFLMVRSGDDAVCADRAIGSYPIKTFVVDVGTRRPLGIGGGSLAILARLPAAVAELSLRQSAQRIAGYPGMSVERVRELMDEAQRRGFVAMDVVAVPGARTVSMAVMTGAGRPVAALSVTAIAARMTPERELELARLLEQEARDLGEILDKRFSSV